MLAYVFWHWPRDDADRDVYEARLLDFHAALASAAVDGFRGSAAFRVRHLPWAPAEPAYEDWYLMDGSAVLDRLNDAAVTGARRPPHDEAAAAAAGGAGGLYRLRAGAADLTRARRAVWITKPEGLDYDEFHRRLEPYTGRDGVALWGRQMVLGPAPEFCLHLPAEAAGVAEEISAPDDADVDVVEVVELRRVGSFAAG